MKLSSFKILLLCYEPSQAAQGHQFKLSLDRLLPDLTSSGRQSLLRHLEIKGYLRVIRVGGESFYRLTNLGREQLEASFPALITKSLHEQVVIFIEPPKHDPQFRYLRRRVLRDQLLPLSRGVYYSPFKLQPLLELELKQSYPGQVAVLGISAWNFGDKVAILQASNQFFLPFSTYSGISNRNERLIVNLNNEKDLIDKDKQQLTSDFDLFLKTLQADPGWNSLVPELAISCHQIIAQFQLLWQTVIL